jgi:hypothetical protein
VVEAATPKQREFVPAAMAAIRGAIMISPRQYLGSRLKSNYGTEILPMDQI